VFIYTWKTFLVVCSLIYSSVPLRMHMSFLPVGVLVCMFSTNCGAEGGTRSPTDGQKFNPTHI
jgi:hypothetical protein